MFSRTLTASAAVLALAAPALAQSDDSSMNGEDTSPAATASMVDDTGEEIGEVRIFEIADGLLIELEANGVPAGGHGFHLHQTGECSGDFSTAGDHYAPAGNGHGFLTEEGPHAGDLPNVFADADGNVRADVTTAVLSIEDGDAPMMDDDGSAFIIHENADTYGAEAGAGARIACGVVEPAS